MSFPLYVHGATDVGQERTRNEDSFAAVQLDDGWLLVVCDGMGGHGGGDLASQRAVQVLQDRLVGIDEATILDEIHQALTAAHVAVLEEAAAEGVPKAGSTAVVVRVYEDRAWVGWIGDSRFYRLRRGLVESVSEDHTRVNEMVARGILTAEEAHQHPDAHVLSRALGGGDPNPAQPAVWSEPLHLERGDVLLLCSDGLYDLVQEAEFCRLGGGLSPQEACERLIDEANSRGGHDNITVVLGVVGQEVVPRPEPAAPEAAGSGGPAPGTVSESSDSEGAPPEPDDRGREPRRRPPPVDSRPSWLMVGVAGLAGLAVGIVLGFVMGQLLPHLPPFLSFQESLAPQVADPPSGTGESRGQGIDEGPASPAQPPSVRVPPAADEAVEPRPEAQPGELGEGGEPEAQPEATPTPESALTGDD